MPKVKNAELGAAQASKSSAGHACETQVPATITIPVDEAEQLYELFKGIEAADRHFQSCQSVSFRTHVQAVYKAVKVSAAFDLLRRKIEKAKEV